MSEKADLILVSDSIFTAASKNPVSGFVSIRNGVVSAVSEGAVPEELISEDTRVIRLGNRTVTPGFIDVHCFFTGYVIRFIGAGLSGCTCEEEVFSKLNEYAETLPADRPLFGHGLKFSISREALDGYDPDRPVVLFAEGCETCSMNSEAVKAFNFTPERFWPEAYAAIFPYILADREFIRPQYEAYMKMMNSRGITSVKEMGFDDFDGFTNILEEMEKDDALTLRVNFMSQPVRQDINFAYGEKMREKFSGNMVTFSGYNQMTDGSVSEFNADLKQPYCGTDTCCMQKIDWEKLGKDAREADSRGFRFSLHAQGDAAIAKTLDIYETCRRDENGKVVLRHAVTDLEFSDPADLERMGKLGVIAEIYPQIQSIASREAKIAMINEKIGAERGRYYWNRRKMADSGVVISCGTDLPLLIDDIPQSVYHAVGAYFPEGGEPFNRENTLTVSELLGAWTCGGAYNLGKEETLGTLEPGKLADIAVLSGNLFETPAEQARDLKVILTVCGGRIVFEGE